MTTCLRRGWPWWGCAAWLLGLGACAPALDWRELRWVADTQLMMPCKPEVLTRSLTLAGQPVAATMRVCDAGGMTWSATAYELPSEGGRDAVLAEAKRLLAENVGASTPSQLSQPSGSAGLTGERLSLLGRRPGGQALQVHALFVAKGRWVMQLTVLADPGNGAAIPRGPAAVDEFLGSLRQIRAAVS